MNAVVRLKCDITPQSVLKTCHDVEARLGRTRRRRWEARVCDLDLIAHSESVLPDPETVRAWMALPQSAAGQRTPDRLILPHPRLHERAFVLVPLLDVAPGWRHPLLGQTARELAAALPENVRAGVSLL